MSSRKNPLFILGVAIIGLVVAFILTSPSYIGICPSENKHCFDPFDEVIGQPLGIFSMCLLFISFVLMFTKQQVFTAWSKFAMIYLPIALILIGIAPAIRGSLIAFDKESLALFLSGIFLITSLAIIAVKSYKLRKN